MGGDAWAGTGGDVAGGTDGVEPAAGVGGAGAELGGGGGDAIPAGETRTRAAVPIRSRRRVELLIGPFELRECENTPVRLRESRCVTKRTPSAPEPSASRK